MKSDKPGTQTKMTQERYINVIKTREESIDEAARFLSMSINAIDEVFVENGYAVHHPELLAVFMQTALLDFHATRFGELLEFIEGHLVSTQSDESES